MSKPHRERLEKAGWKVGTAAEFLELGRRRGARGSQARPRRRRAGPPPAGTYLAAGPRETDGLEPSRVAKVENHDPEVSLDLQLRAVFAAHPAARREFCRLVEKWALSGE